jgi:hypothetical protein
MALAVRRGVAGATNCVAAKRLQAVSMYSNHLDRPGDNFFVDGGRARADRQTKLSVSYLDS